MPRSTSFCLCYRCRTKPCCNIPAVDRMCHCVAIESVCEVVDLSVTCGWLTGSVCGFSSVLAPLFSVITLLGLGAVVYFLSTSRSYGGLGIVVAGVAVCALLWKYYAVMMEREEMLLSRVADALGVTLKLSHEDSELHPVAAAHSPSHPPEDVRRPDIVRGFHNEEHAHLKAMLARKKISEDQDVRAPHQGFRILTASELDDSQTIVKKDAVDSRHRPSVTVINLPPPKRPPRPSFAQAKSLTDSFDSKISY